MQNFWSSFKSQSKYLKVVTKFNSGLISVFIGDLQFWINRIFKVHTEWIINVIQTKVMYQFQNEYVEYYKKRIISN